MSMLMMATMSMLMMATTSMLMKDDMSMLMVESRARARDGCHEHFHIKLKSLARFTSPDYIFCHKKVYI